MSRNSRGSGRLERRILVVAFGEVLEVAVLESVMLRAPRALKTAQGVIEADCAAMFEICGRMRETGGCFWWKASRGKSCVFRGSVVGSEGVKWQRVSGFKVRTK